MRIRPLVVPLSLAPLAGALLATQGGPPFTPEEALRSFRLADGFQIEIVAAEPLVADPVAMEVDENGRIYVVEMPGYPLDVSGSGRVVLLSDQDGDGRADHSTVFAEGLKLPTGVMRWKKGVLVTDSPEVWYLEDRDGDGRADVKEAVLTGFALSNPQHNTNGPLYGLDNWIYLANEGPVRTTRFADLFGDAGSEVHFPARPDGPRLPPDAAGRNVRFRPDSGELEMLSARSQFGHAFDAWGHHFLVSNARPIYQEVVAARYLARNPALAVASITDQTPDYRLPAQVFPITRGPEFQLLTDVGLMTSASGLTWYLADLFPASYRNAVFVAEAAHNLVHVDTVRPEASTFRAGRMFADREFLASTDPWFRPVNFYVGPDGALYIIDYYRRILEHPEWMDEATSRSGELYAGRERGRIYRVTPTGTARAGWIDRLRLGEASVEELVRALDHPNVWWRRHAQRLLVERKPAQAVRGLERLAATGTPAGRVHALWTLEGLGRLQRGTIERALGDASAGVRENAIRLAELHLARTPALAGALLRVADEPDGRARLQLLLTLGDLAGEEAAAARRRLLFENVEDSWMQIAALSAREWGGLALLREATERLGDRETPVRRALLSRVGDILATVGSAEDVARGVEFVAARPEGWVRTAALEGLRGGLRRPRPDGSDLAALRDHVAALLPATPPPAPPPPPSGPPTPRQAAARYEPILSLEGDAARGREVFARVCSGCHQYRGAGGTPFGPDLGEVSHRLPFSILVDILHPNQSIADGFELRLARLVDGSRVTGIVESETPTSVTLRRSGAEPITLPRDRIALMTPLDVSAMPEGLDAQMTPQAMADLLAYIRSAR